MAFLIPVFAVFGLFVGSFLNVCIDRLPKGQSIIFPPSHCAVCNHKLAVIDLVPVFSYLFLRGRCRYCQARIPLRIPIVEAVTGLSFGLLAWKFGLNWQLGLFLVYASVLIVIFVIDLENQLVLDKITFPAMVVAFAFSLFWPQIKSVPDFGAGSISQSVASFGGEPVSRGVISLLGGALGFIAYLIPYALSRGGMGFGDVKLGGLIGLMVGYPLAIVAVLLSWIAGGILAAVLLAFKVKGAREPIPSATIMAVAAMVTLLWGPQLLRWYL